MLKVVLSTIADVERAEQIIATRLQERLVACVNVVPRIVSHYRWKGQVQREPEQLLVLKTASDRADALIARLGELHPYDVPEIVVLDVPSGGEAYLSWVFAETRTTG